MPVVCFLQYLISSFCCFVLQSENPGKAWISLLHLAKSTHTYLPETLQDTIVHKTLKALMKIRLWLLQCIVWTSFERLLFPSVSWYPTKANWIDWNTAYWCFCITLEANGNLPPLLLNGVIGLPERIWDFNVSCLAELTNYPAVAIQAEDFSSLGSLSLSKLVCHHNCWPSLLLTAAQVSD